MDNELTSRERENLINSHRKERDARTRDRIKAVLAYDDGFCKKMVEQNRCKAL